MERQLYRLAVHNHQCNDISVSTPVVPELYLLDFLGVTNLR